MKTEISNVYVTEIVEQKMLDTGNLYYAFKTNLYDDVFKVEWYIDFAKVDGEDVLQANFNELHEVTDYSTQVCEKVLYHFLETFITYLQENFSDS